MKREPMTDETKKKISISKKGSIPWNKDKKVPQLIGNTNGFKKGHKPFNKGMKGEYKFPNRKPISEQDKDNIRQTLKRKYASGELVAKTPTPKYGVDHPNYKGGLPKCIDCGKELSSYEGTRCRQCYYKSRILKDPRPLDILCHRIRTNSKYRLWRDDVFNRDGFVCTECNSDIKLEAHHLKQLMVIVKEHNITTLQEALDCAEIWDINNGQTLCKQCHSKLNKDIIK